MRPGRWTRHDDPVTGTPEASSAAGYRPGTTEYRRVLVALFVAGLATFAVLYSPQGLLPELSAQFDVSATSATLSLSLTTFGLGVALLVAGPLSDVVGRTRLIYVSLWASALVAVACAVAPGWTALLALRCSRASSSPVSRQWRRHTCARSCTRRPTPAPP